MDNIFLSHSYDTRIPAKICLYHNTDTNLHINLIVTLLRNHFSFHFIALHCIAREMS